MRRAANANDIAPAVPPHANVTHERRAGGAKFHPWVVAPGGSAGLRCPGHDFQRSRRLGRPARTQGAEARA
jgi:hypothetical protein